MHIYAATNPKWKCKHNEQIVEEKMIFHAPANTKTKGHKNAII